MGCCNSSEVSHLKHAGRYCCLKLLQVVSQRSWRVCNDSVTYSTVAAFLSCLLFGSSRVATATKQPQLNTSICASHFTQTFIYALAEQTWLETAGGSQLHRYPMAHRIHAVLYWDGKFHKCACCHFNVRPPRQEDTVKVKSSSVSPPVLGLLLWLKLLCKVSLWIEVCSAVFFHWVSVVCSCVRVIIYCNTINKYSLHKDQDFKSAHMNHTLRNN